MGGVPKPVLPKLDLSEEVYITDIEEKENEENGNESGLSEGLSKSIARVLGFVCAIGLPPELMKAKVVEYSEVAEETGVCDALLDVIEYYFPDMNVSPAAMVLITGIAFLSYVAIDRIELSRQLKKNKKEKEPEKKINNAKEVNKT